MEREFYIHAFNPHFTSIAFETFVFMCFFGNISLLSILILRVSPLKPDLWVISDTASQLSILILRVSPLKLESKEVIK